MKVLNKESRITHASRNLVSVSLISIKTLIRKKSNISTS